MKSKLKQSESGWKSIPQTVITSDASQSLSTIQSPLSSARKRDNGQAQLIKEFTKKIKAGWSPEDIVASFQEIKEKDICTKRIKSTRSIRKTKSENNFLYPSRRVHVKSPRSRSEPHRKNNPPSVVELLGENVLRKNISFRKRENGSIFNETLSTLTQEDKTLPDFLGEVIAVPEKLNKFKGRTRYKSGSNETVSISNTTLSTLTQEGKLPDLSEEIIAFYKERKILKGRPKQERMTTPTKMPSRNVINGIGSNYGSIEQNKFLDDIAFEKISSVMERSKLQKRSSHLRQKRKLREDSPKPSSEEKYLSSKGKRWISKNLKQIEDGRKCGGYGEEYAY